MPLLRDCGGVAVASSHGNHASEVGRCIAAPMLRFAKAYELQVNGNGASVVDASCNRHECVWRFNADGASEGGEVRVMGG